MAIMAKTPPPSAGARGSSTHPSSSPSSPSPSPSSAALKLQNFLVLKAFNLRKGKQQTLVQQFHFLTHKNTTTNKDVLQIQSLCDYLGIPPFRCVVLCHIFKVSGPTDSIDFDAFVRFLQTAAVHAAHEERQLHKHLSSSTTTLPAPPPAACCSTTGENNQSLVCFAPSLLSMRFAHPPPAPGLWKKREITIQERITEYTKIDDFGRAQHLVESEKHQSEVIHMEALNGEFAHREITQFETLEKLNDEIVHHETGKEEFVHLKSEHDEISKFESSTPNNNGNSGPQRPEECEQPPPSPTIKRDPSAAMDDGRGFQSPGRGGGGGGDGEGMAMTAEEEEEYYKYQRQYAGQEHREGEVGGDTELETLVEDASEFLDQYPMEPPPME